MMLARIREIQRLREERKSIMDREKALSDSCLSDYSLLPRLFEWFRQLDTAGDSEPRMRKRFCFVCLYLYAPSSLVGAKLPHGLRNAMARVLGVAAQNCVTFYCKNLLFYFERYPDFRNGVLPIFEVIHERLLGEGLLKS